MERIEQQQQQQQQQTSVTGNTSTLTLPRKPPHQQHYESPQAGTLGATSKTASRTLLATRPPAAQQPKWSPQDLVESNLLDDSTSSSSSAIFDRLCTDVRQCRFLPATKTAASSVAPSGAGRFRLRSINDINLPHSRRSSQS